MAKRAKLQKNTNYDEELLKFVSSRKKPVKSIDYNSGDSIITVDIKGTLPFSERIAMVKEICDMVFVNDDIDLMSYQPSLTEFAKRCAVISHYTGIKLPASAEELWDLLNSTPFYDDVLEHAGDEIRVIFAEADELIASRRDYIIHNAVFNGIGQKIIEFIDKIPVAADNVDLNKIVNMLNGLPNVSGTAIVDRIIDNITKEDKLKTKKKGADKE